MNAFLSIIILSYKECVFYNSRTKVNSAYAGNTCQNWQIGGQQRDYPRLRGEYIKSHINFFVNPGSPPLARGIHKKWHCNYLLNGITPARAGNTQSQEPFFSFYRDHPRSRGEYGFVCGFSFLWMGSPPLARGIPDFLLFLQNLRGITPARAGNTSCASCAIWAARDHPRSRGEYLRYKSLRYI